MENIAYKKDYMVTPLPHEYMQKFQDIENAYEKNKWELNCNKLQENEQKVKMIQFMISQIEENNLDITGYSVTDLAQQLYSDIFESSILTKPLQDPNVKTIEITSWYSVNIIFSNNEKINIGGFPNAQVALKVLQRMVKQDINFKDSSYFQQQINNVKITAVLSPIIDDNTAVIAYIDKLDCISEMQQDDINKLKEYILLGKSMIINGDETSVRDCLDYICKSTAQTDSILVVDPIKKAPMKHVSYLQPTEASLQGVMKMRNLNIFIYDTWGFNTAYKLAHKHTVILAQSHKDDSYPPNDLFPIIVHIGYNENGNIQINQIEERGGT